MGLSAQFYRLPNLLDQIDVARADGRLLRLPAQLKKVDYLILDDWGMAPLRPSSRQELLMLIDDRNDLKTTAITAQLPVDKWYDFIGEPTAADAIMDRLMNSSHRIELKVDSLRKLRPKAG